MSASPHQGRGWAVVILLAVVIVLGIVVLLPASRAFADQGDETAQAQEDLASYQAQIAARPRLSLQLKALNADEAARATLLDGANAALAAANMQSLVKDLVERHGGQLRSAQTLEASVAHGLEKVVVQYEIALPLGSLKAVSYALETGTPHLMIDEAQIRPELDTGASADAPAMLHVTWTVHGYRKAGAP